MQNSEPTKVNQKEDLMKASDNSKQVHAACYREYMDPRKSEKEIWLWESYLSFNVNSIHSLIHIWRCACHGSNATNWVSLSFVAESQSISKCQHKIIIQWYPNLVPWCNLGQPQASWDGRLSPNLDHGHCEHNMQTYTLGIINPPPICFQKQLMHKYTKAHNWINHLIQEGWYFKSSAYIIRDKSKPTNIV